MTIKTNIQPASNILPFIAMIEVNTPNLAKADRDFLWVMKRRCIDHSRAVWVTAEKQDWFGRLLMEMCEHGPRRLPPASKATH